MKISLLVIIFKLLATYHCVYKLTYHLVLVTKYRKKCFTGTMLDRLKEIVNDLCQKWEIELLEFNGESDHVHLLLDMHLTLCLVSLSIT